MFLWAKQIQNWIFCTKMLIDTKREKSFSLDLKCTFWGQNRLKHTKLVQSISIIFILLGEYDFERRLLLEVESHRSDYAKIMTLRS